MYLAWVFECACVRVFCWWCCFVGCVYSRVERVFPCERVGGLLDCWCCRVVAECVDGRCVLRA